MKSAVKTVSNARDGERRQWAPFSQGGEQGRPLGGEV